MLTLKKAKQIAAAAIEEALKNQLKIVVAILDNHGNLKYFERMDGTSYGSIRIAQLKANTSASMPVPSSEIAERNKKLAGAPYASIQGMLGLAGGLPIFNDNNEHIGAIGVSGATPDLDEQCAQAGIAA